MSAKTKRHPKGLYVLFFTEMWERFGYYLMLGIFSLYMLDSAENGGMGFDPQKKSDVYGTYIGLVYLTPFIGGLLADRLLGYRRSIIIGGLLMAAGYLGLAIPGNVPVFYTSLLLIIVGNGFFKPNISTLVGNLYNDDRYRDNKDAGYNIFYMGINIGSFFCNFVAAFMRINYGWGYAFAAAGIGMLLGLVIFIMGTRHIRSVDVIKPVDARDLSLAKIFAMVLLPVFGFGILGYFISGITSESNPGGNIFGSDANDAFLFGCVPVIVFYASLWWRANEEDKRPVGALLSVFFAVIVFWAVFHQNGDALTVWAEDHTDREMPHGVASAAKAVDMAQEVRDTKWNYVTQEKFDAHIDSLKNIQEDLKASKKKDEVKKITKEISITEKSRKYFSNLPPDRRPGEDKSLLLFSTELYQSINPFWVVLLTPVIVGLFGFLRRRKREPSTPAKIAIGLFVTGLSTLVMVAAVSSTQLENEKASSWWLIMSYGVITIGELCLSPMGLSLVSKLSPPRLTALMMGGWFLSTAVGNKLSGIMSGMWEGFDNKANFFWMNFGACMFAFLLLFMMLKWLRSVMSDKGIK